MSTDTKYILVDGKYIFNADHVETIKSMHTVVELDDKSKAPSGATDLSTSSVINEETYNASCEVGIFLTAGTIDTNILGDEILAEITDKAPRQGVRSAIRDRAVEFSWYNK